MLWLALLSCGKVGDDGYEGNDVGECTDAADNDRDGYFDCDDNGCWGSPDCDGQQDTDTDTDSDSDADSDADTDSDTDTDTDPDLARLADFQAFSVAYTLTWDFDDAYQEMLDFYGLADCVSHYVGDGTPYDVDGTKVTFTGHWRLEDSTCAETLQSPDAVWYDDSGEAYATLRYSDDGVLLEDWIEHQDPTATDAGEKNQWFITNMAEPFDWGTLHAYHTETESTTIEGIIPLDLIHEADFQLSE